MSVPPPRVTEPNRYAHLTWPQVAEIVAQTWAASGDPDERAVCRVLLETLDGLSVPPSVWRARHAAAGDAAPIVESGRSRKSDVDVAFELAQATAGDGRQRALEVDAGSLGSLQELRLSVRARPRAEPDGSNLRRVMPWIWNSATSGGTAMTANGTATGYELRLSRYRNPVT